MPSPAASARPHSGRREASSLTPSSRAGSERAGGTRERRVMAQGVGLLLLAREAGERGPVAAVPVGEADFHRVHEVAVDAALVMRVRPGGGAGRADIADHLPLVD